MGPGWLFLVLFIITPGEGVAVEGEVQAREAATRDRSELRKWDKWIKSARGAERWRFLDRQEDR